MKKPLLQKLIQEIAMFDMDAAFTLHCRMGNEGYKDKDNLNNAMSWRQTPEGYDHWNDVNDKLEARREKYHPHRDLMIEHANDKTIEIEFLGDRKDEWKNIENPSFLDNEKYRKKPKVTKKVIEYRIYLDTHGEINIVERDAELNIRHLKDWLGDWQKVEIDVEENN